MLSRCQKIVNPSTCLDWTIEHPPTTTLDPACNASLVDLRHLSRVLSRSWLTCTYLAGEKWALKNEVFPTAGGPTKRTSSALEVPVLAGSGKRSGVDVGEYGGTVKGDLNNYISV